MRKLLTYFLIGFIVFNCKNESKNQVDAEIAQEVSFDSFGKKIIADDAIAASSMATHYKSMRVG